MGRRSCPEEEDFWDLYELIPEKSDPESVSQARDRQAAIRKKNPDGRHCFDSMTSPFACIGCPKNPAKGRSAGKVKKENKLLADNLGLIQQLIQDAAYAARGLISRREMTPEEAAAYHLIWEIREAQRENRDAKRMQNFMEAMAQAFTAGTGAKMIGKGGPKKRRR